MRWSLFTRNKAEIRKGGLGRYLKRNLNFYRVHLLFFTFTPLIFSAILYGSNGDSKFPIAYIDALFNSQFILFFLMCVGNPVIISFVMVFIRRQFFKIKFRHMIQAELSRRVEQRVEVPVNVTIVPWWVKFFRTVLGRNPTLPHVEKKNRDGSETPPRVRVDMIRRMDDAPRLVNPSGWISEGHAESPNPPPPPPQQEHPRSPGTHQLAFANMTPVASLSEETDSVVEEELNSMRDKAEMDRKQRLSDPGKSGPAFNSSEGTSTAMQRFQTMNIPRTTTFPRSQTVEFASEPRRRTSTERGRVRERRPSIGSRNSLHPEDTRMNARTMSRHSVSQYGGTHASHHTQPRRSKHSGFGGFPMPHEIISRLFRKFFPKLERKLTRTITMPRTQTLASQRGYPASPGARPVSYITFEAVVGPNSKFERLTREQLDELGGVEYRGLTALLWIVGGYHIVLQLVSFIVIAPYMSIPRWKEDFEVPAEHRNVNPVWYSLFQVVSSYTNTGMSLVDQSMVPFQTAYPMIVLMIILILAGNTAFPIFLRATIWMIAKVTPKNSRSSETLHFLLDHPRRCFIYLFPSHQTWFLLTVLIGLNVTDWFFFLVLDIGNPAIESVPFGVRFLLGLLQAAAVRAAGFGSIPLSALAPAVKVLYVLMMYISVYPIAMSVRSTNVYEEKSLGVFHQDDESLREEDISLNGNRATVWSRYLAMHMRKQLSFDMWWLGLALFLVCIIERDGLEDTETQGWFNIFTILFELVSAYGSVGLSLGLPYANYSFSGALRPLSKLIVIAVMLRGRHRGLPVAIDRAVMLPIEFRGSSGELNGNNELVDDELDLDTEESEESDEVESSEEQTPVEDSPTAEGAMHNGDALSEKTGNGTIEPVPQVDHSPEPMEGYELETIDERTSTHNQLPARDS
ncbi:Potassium transport protein [Abortiporus biennis]